MNNYETYDNDESIDSRLGYDADHTDPNQYCIHGTWIGSWWGPDYLCGACEQGITLYDMAHTKVIQNRTYLTKTRDDMVAAFPAMTRGYDRMSYPTREALHTFIKLWGREHEAAKQAHPALVQAAWNARRNERKYNK